MSWLFFIVLSSFLFAAGNIFEKFVVSKHVTNKNIMGYLGIAFLLNIWQIFVFFPFADLTAVNLKVYSLLFLRTLALTIGIFFSAKLFMKEEVSRIISILFANMILAFILDYLIFGTKLAFLGYLGAIILLASAILMTYKPSKKVFIDKKDMLYLIILMVLWGVYAIIIKSITSYLTPLTFMFMDAVNFFSIVIILYCVSYKVRKNIKVFIMAKKNFWIPYFIMSLCYMFAVYTYYRAFSLQKVSVLVPFETLQATFVLFIALFLSHYFPKLIKEEIDKKTISYKIVSLILLTVGVYFMVKYGAA